MLFIFFTYSMTLEAMEVQEASPEQPVEAQQYSVVVTQEALDEAVEAFNLFDKQSPGWIFTKDFPIVMRSVGYSLSAADLKLMEADADPNGSGYISQPDFIRQIYKAVEFTHASSANARKSMMNMADNINLLLGSVMDKHRTMSREDFKHIMTRVGEKLSNDEFDDLCASLDTSSGRISVDNMINFLML